MAHNRKEQAIREISTQIKTNNQPKIDYNKTYYINNDGTLSMAREDSVEYNKEKLK